MIFAFAKTPDDNLASLAKELDKAVAANSEKKLAAVLNFTGEATDEYKAKVKEFVEKNDLKNTAVMVTSDAERMKVADSAQVTVMHYKGKQVKYNYSTEKPELPADAVKQIVAGVDKTLE